MKTHFIFMIFILFTSLSISQSGFSNTSKVTNEYWDYDEPWQRPKFELGLGVFIPQGNLATFINPSPFVDLGVYFPAKRNKSIALVLQLVDPSQNESFIVSNPDAIEQTEAIESEFIMNAFLRFSQNLTKKTSIHKLELGIGIGISTMFIETPFTFFNNDDENASRGLVSFLAAPGLHWKFKPTKNSHITIGTDIQYIPYNRKGAIDSDIGGVAIAPRVLYRF